MEPTYSLGSVLDPNRTSTDVAPIQMPQGGLRFLSGNILQDSIQHISNTRAWTLGTSRSPGTRVIPINIREVDLHAAGDVPAPILEILQNSNPQLSTVHVSGDVHMHKFRSCRMEISVYIRSSLGRTPEVVPGTV